MVGSHEVLRREKLCRLSCDEGFANGIGANPGFGPVGALYKLQAICFTQRLPAPNPPEHFAQMVRDYQEVAPVSRLVSKQLGQRRHHVRQLMAGAKQAGFVDIVPVGRTVPVGIDAQGQGALPRLDQ